MKKLKMFTMVLSICFLLNFTNTTYAMEVAKPNNSPVLVNEEKVEFDAYTIKENNYFKLRDIAEILKDTGAKFEVSWDGENNAINIILGEDYTSVGEKTLSKTKDTKEAKLSTSKILLNDEEVKLTAYTIGENNYFKLRDLGESIGFLVGWDQETSTISINTSQDEVVEETMKFNIVTNDTKIDAEKLLRTLQKAYGNWGYLVNSPDGKSSYQAQASISNDAKINVVLTDMSTQKEVQRFSGKLRGDQKDGEIIFDVTGEGVLMNIKGSGDETIGYLSLIEGEDLFKIEAYKNYQDVLLDIAAVYGRILELEVIGQPVKIYMIPGGNQFIFN